MPDEAPLDRPEAQEHELFLTTNLYPRRTGLPMTVWVGPRSGARHDVSVNVNTQPGERMDLESAAVVAVGPQPHLIHGRLGERDLALVTEWIRLNEDVILRHWTGEYDGVDLGQNVMRLPG